jgi:hypothetical protein
VSFGAYLLAKLGYGVFSFNDVPEAHEELVKQIEQARADLSKRGVSVDWTGRIMGLDAGAIECGILRDKGRAMPAWSCVVYAMLPAKGTSMCETDLVESLRRELSTWPVVVFLYDARAVIYDDTQWVSVLVRYTMLASISIVGNIITTDFDFITSSFETTNILSVVSRPARLT